MAKTVEPRVSTVIIEQLDLLTPQYPNGADVALVVIAYNSGTEFAHYVD